MIRFLTPLLLFLLANGYGWYRTEIWQAPPTGRLQVALVQPFIELGQNRDYYARRYFEDLPALYQAAVAGGAEVFARSEGSSERLDDLAVAVKEPRALVTLEHSADGRCSPIATDSSPASAVLLRARVAVPGQVAATPVHAPV